MAEVRVIPKPEALPGQCVYCGGASKERYLDTGLSYEFYGVVYICVECFSGLASHFDFISPELYLDLKSKYDRLLREHEENTLKLIAMHQAVNALKVAGLSDESTSDADDDESAPFVDASVLTNHPSNPEFLQGSAEQGSSDDSGSTESSNDERVDDLSSVESGELEFKW